MLMPPVSRYMTMHPYSIGPHEKLSSARRLMRSAGIHHLPVMHDEELVGVISDRDLYPLNSLRDVSVGDTMSEPVITVMSQTPLDEVLTLMENQKCGSVVVVGAAGIEGIFTVTDALRAFSDVLRRNVENQP
jgi:acetoin utilization protein AcuB